MDTVLIPGVLVLPPLTIQQCMGNELLLAWPASATGLQLMSATNLMPPVRWTQVTDAPVSSNGQWQVTLPIPADAHRFYRLQSP